MKPYYQDSAVTIYHGDCREILPQLEPVDLVLTDPPYGVNIAGWDKEMPPQSILDECLRLSEGSVIWFGSAPLLLQFASYKPQPDRMMIWAPKFTLSKIAKDGFAYRFHPIAIWRSQKQSFIPWDVVDDSTECGNWWLHPGTKPLSLMKKLLTAFDADTVIDPYLGSGTTLRAAKDLGLKAIGIEIEEKYCEIAAKRMGQEVLQFTAAGD